MVLDEFTREYLAIDVGKRIRSKDVLEVLRCLSAVRGTRDSIRSDNGPEFASKAVRKWRECAGVETLFVAQASQLTNMP